MPVHHQVQAMAERTGALDTADECIADMAAAIRAALGADHIAAS